jgi:putative ABC transport system permease protein
VVIGVITVLGSSIALMNIMIVSVTERTREIGVRLKLRKNNDCYSVFYRDLIDWTNGRTVGIILESTFESPLPWISLL